MWFFTLITYLAFLVQICFATIAIGKLSNGGSRHPMLIKCLNWNLFSRRTVLPSGNGRRIYSSCEKVYMVDKYSTWGLCDFALETSNVCLFCR